MDFDLFRQELLNDVAIRASADRNFSHSAFVDASIDLLADAEEVSDFEPCYFRGKSGARNVGLDGYAFDGADSSLRLFIAEADFAAEASSLNMTDVRALFNRLRAFVEDTLSGKIFDILDDESPAHEFADLLKKRWSNVSRIRAYVLSDGQLNTKTKDWPEGTLANVPIEFHVWDSARLYRAYSSRTGRDELVVDFEAITGGIGVPYINAKAASDGYDGYLCIIPANVLADIYDEYGSRLLEGNVRSFLTTKRKVNRNIRLTLLKHPHMFFAYNNGIAATASSIAVRENANYNSIITATDLQIVNGGQTTASISTARRVDKASLAGVFVPMKLSVVSAENAAVMIPKIAEYANSQNKVNDADFFSNHDFHRRMEKISRRIWAPAQIGTQHETHWFYERARGQYMNAMAALSSSERRAFKIENPKAQLVLKTDLAKSENSWQCLPHVVSRGAQTNFLHYASSITKQWDADSEAFHDAFYKCAVARIIAFRKTEAIVSGQDWYNGSYRANIVTYTIARLAQEIRDSGRFIDFAAIWRAQDITDAFAQQIAIVAQSMYSVITSASRPMENVTQWCKQEACWEQAKRVRVSILPLWEAELAARETVLEENKAARTIQRIDSSLDAQVSVMALGSDYWRQLRKWATSRDAVSQEDQNLLTSAGHPEYVPSDRQASRLLHLRDRLEHEGFVFVANS